MLITFWDRRLFYLDEKQSPITDLKVEDFFGLKLATTMANLIMKSSVKPSSIQQYLVPQKGSSKACPVTAAAFIAPFFFHWCCYFSQIFYRTRCLSDNQSVSALN